MDAEKYAVVEGNESEFSSSIVISTKPQTIEPRAFSWKIIREFLREISPTATTWTNADLLLIKTHTNTIQWDLNQKGKTSLIRKYLKPLSMKWPLCIVQASLSWYVVMMTSPNRCIFRFTDPLWGESTVARWIPLTKATEAELWCFLSAPEQWSRKKSRRRWFQTPSPSLRRHCVWFWWPYGWQRERCVFPLSSSLENRIKKIFCNKYSWKV